MSRVPGPWSGSRSELCHGEHGFLQLHRDPVLGPGDVLLAPQRLMGAAHHLLAAPQRGDIAQHGPHGGGAAVRVEHGLAHHVQGADASVGVPDAELAVYRLAVHQAVRDERGEQGLVLGEQRGGQVVERQPARLRRPAEDPEEFVGPADLVGEQIPFGAAHPADQGALGLGGGGLFARGPFGLLGQPLPELSEVGAEVVEVVHRQLAERALPAHPRVVLVDAHGVAPHRVHITAQPARPVDQRVDGIALRRLWGGAVRREGDGMTYSDAGRHNQ